MLLKALQFSQYFIDINRQCLNAILIEKHQDNIFRFVATNSSYLSILEIDFTKFENDLLRLNTLLLDKNEVLINCSNNKNPIDNNELGYNTLKYTLIEKYLTALKYNLNFDFHILEADNFPKYKEIITEYKLKIQENELKQPTFDNNFLSNLTNASQVLKDYYGVRITLDVINNSKPCKFKIITQDNNIKDCYVIIQPYTN